MKNIRQVLFCIIVMGFGLMATSRRSYAQAKKTGVLILAHGGSSPIWDNTVEDATQALKNKYLAATAFGMADPVTMQAGIDKLEKEGAKTIVVVPLFISSYSMIIRQNEYLLGLRNKLADPPMIMSHGSHGSSTASSGDIHGKHEPDHSTHNMSTGKGNSSMGGSHHMNMGNEKKKTEEKTWEEQLPQLKIKAKIILTPALNDNHFVSDIIYDRIKELSIHPSDETVLIVAHGPLDEEDNKKWVETIDKIADNVRAKELENGNHFKQIFSLTVRDDNDSAVYNQAKEYFRNLVYQAGKQGEVIVIPLLLSKGGIESGYVKRLEGLKYKWSGKTLLPDPKITSFVEESVAEALKK